MQPSKSPTPQILWRRRRRRWNLELYDDNEQDINKLEEVISSFRAATESSEALAWNNWSNWLKKIHLQDYQEVNPLSKKEMKWSEDYKKVPILMVDGEKMVDSSDIIDKLPVIVKMENPNK